MNVPINDLIDFVRARSTINEWFDKRYPKGKELEWVRGRFKGRRCVINEGLWEVRRDGTMECLIRASTYRIDGRVGFEGEERFIDTNDDYHRTYREVSHWFKEIS